MIFRSLASSLGIALCLASVDPCPAATSPSQADDQVIAAEEAYSRGDLKSLEQAARSLGEHVLLEYVRFWQLHANLAAATGAEVQEFLKRYPDGPLAQRLRVDWLKILGKRQAWEEFTAFADGADSAEDVELNCYHLQRRLQDKQALAAAKPLWLTGKSQPDSCDPVFERMLEAGVLSRDDVWQRLRLALEAGNLGLVRRVNDHLPQAQALDDKRLEEARRHPRRYLDKTSLAGKSRAARETAMFAVLQLARKDAREAADSWADIERRFPVDDRGYVWGQLGYRAALDHEPVALAYYRKAEDAPLNDLQLGWRTRAALRAGNWGEVLESIDRMTPEESALTSWRYWKARALKVRQKDAESRALMASLLDDPRFYGQLAREALEVELPASADIGQTPPEANGLEQAKSIKKALALFRLGLVNDAVREWNWAIRDFDDGKLVAAADLAQKANWYERSIATAERFTHSLNHALRFPMPFREVIETNAKQNQLDPSWVLGLVKQESRFWAAARSSAGALGLMQLMPATARWVARQVGLNGFHPADTLQPDVNISLGTYYLRHVADELGHEVLATAAYNAGPGRAARWRDAKPLEGAIYAETIPFNETRDYVRKVMLNATWYARRLGGKAPTLTERLGVVPGKSGAPESHADQTTAWKAQ